MPNVERYGLDKAGVAILERKAIGIDDDMRTNVGHISPSATSPACCSWRMWPRPTRRQSLCATDVSAAATPCDAAARHVLPAPGG